MNETSRDGGASLEITIRPASWPADETAISAIDTSFECASVYTVSREGLSFHLAEQPVSPPVTKRYPLDLGEHEVWDLSLVAECDGKIVGFAAAQHLAWNRRMAIHHLYVDASARGLGIGSRILDCVGANALEFGARSLWLETQNVNVPAVKFYLRSEFSLCGLDTGLYDPATDEGREVALFLERPILRV